MKLLFDQNLSFRLCEALNDIFPEASHVQLHGAPPQIIWLRCGNQRTAFIEELIRAHAYEIHEFVKESSLACLEI